MESRTTSFNGNDMERLNYTQYQSLESNEYNIEGAIALPIGTTNVRYRSSDV